MKHVAAALLPEDMRGNLRMRGHARRRPWLDADLFRSDPFPGMCETLGLSVAKPIEGLSEAPALMQRLWSVLLRESLPALLRYEDRNSAAFSIEARVPFLARSVVELAMRLPMREKIRDGSLKAVVREAMRGVVPDLVLDRRDKIGFSAPTGEWMRGGLRNWWREAVSSQSFLGRGWFSPKGVLQLIGRFDAGDASASIHLWRLAIVEQWARQFLDG